MTNTTNKTNRKNDKKKESVKDVFLKLSEAQKLEALESAKFDEFLDTCVQIDSQKTVQKTADIKAVILNRIENSDKLVDEALTKYALTHANSYAFRDDCVMIADKRFADKSASAHRVFEIWPKKDRYEVKVNKDVANELLLMREVVTTDNEFVYLNSYDTTKRIFEAVKSNTAFFKVNSTLELIELFDEFMKLF